MVDGVHALLGTIAEEIDRALVQPLLIGLGTYHVGTHLADDFQRTVVEGCIDLHATGVEHRTQQGVLLLYGFPEQDRNAHQFEGGHADELQVAAVADALSHRHTNAQTCIGTWATAHADGIEGDGVVVGKRQGLVNHRTQFLGTCSLLAVLFLLEDALPVL